MEGDGGFPARRWRPLRGSDPGLAEALGAVPWEPIQVQPGRTAYRAEVAGRPYFVKHYRPLGFERRVRELWVRPKPQRAFDLGRRLQGAGLPTPRPLGLYARGGMLPREVLLVAEWVESPRDWASYLTVDRSPALDLAGFRAAADDLAAALARLHALGYYHGDLRGNLLFGGAGAKRAYLIDLEDLRRGVTRRRRAKNLADLAQMAPDPGVISLRERWRFLRCYAAAAELTTPEARRLWRAARDASRAWYRRRSLNW